MTSINRHEALPILARDGMMTLLEGHLQDHFDGTFEDRAQRLEGFDRSDYAAFIAKHPQYSNIPYERVRSEAFVLGELLLENEGDF